MECSLVPRVSDTREVRFKCSVCSGEYTAVVPSKDYEMFRETLKGFEEVFQCGRCSGRLPSVSLEDLKNVE